MTTIDVVRIARRLGWASSRSGPALSLTRAARTHGTHLDLSRRPAAPRVALPSGYNLRLGSGEIFCARRPSSLDAAIDAKIAA